MKLHGINLLARRLCSFGNAFHRLRIALSATRNNAFGTALGQVMRVIKIADERFVAEHVSPGLSTGEGVIWHVRDEITKREPIKERGRTIDFHEVISDEGVLDKRLLVISSEFAQVLRVIEIAPAALMTHSDYLHPLVLKKLVDSVNGVTA